MASAAAIFMGCWRSMILAWLSPKNIVATMATAPTTRASWAEVAKTGRGAQPARRSFNRCQPLTPKMSIVEVTSAENRTCRNEPISVLLVITAQKLVITARLPTTL